MLRSHRQDGAADSSELEEPNGKLNLAAAQFYAAIYAAARAGCISELRPLCGEEQAEELFMATLSKVMATVDPIARDFAPGQMVNLLKVACRRRLIDDRRHRAVIREVELEEVGPALSVSSDGPDEVAQDRETVAIGREALCSLSERDRLIFLQRYELGLEPEEICHNIPGLSPRAYRRAIQRANERVFSAFDQIESGERCRQLLPELLRRYVAEESNRSETALVKAHLRHCRGCRDTAARLSGQLHDVASSLVVVSAGTGAVGPGLVERAGQMTAAPAVELWHRLNSTWRWAREGLYRLSGLLPGNGDAVVGQSFGAATVKLASICATGAAAATCVAAGVLPGIAGTGISDANHQRAPVPPRPAKVSAPRAPRRDPVVASVPASPDRPASTPVAPPPPPRRSPTSPSTHTTIKSSAVDPAGGRSESKNTEVQSEFGIEASVQSQPSNEPASTSSPPAETSSISTPASSATAPTSKPVGINPSAANEAAQGEFRP